MADLHLDRGRAVSFGSVARQYDRYRPACPDELADDLAAGQPDRTLDVGCGTGKVAVALARRGLSVLGVEPDPRMAEVARGHGVPVELAAFESWDPAGRRFDLITCGDAWHWIDPVRGLRRAAALLRPGAVIARHWTYHVLAEPARTQVEAVYRRYAPDAHTHGHPPGPIGMPDRFATSPVFRVVDTRTYWRDRTVTAAEWVGLVATFSDHQRLAPARLGDLSRALCEVIDALGGQVPVRCASYLVLARRR